MSRRIRRAAVIAGLALFAALPAAAQAKKVISISGSTSVFPLTSKLARAWIKTKQGSKYSFSISQGGSNVGISDVAKGAVTAGESSREPATGDPAGLVFTPISRDALCVITNSSNPLANISAATVKSIFVGPGISDWSKVPGAPIGGTIDPIGRAPTSGTHDAFRTIFLGGTNQGAFVQGLASNGLVQQGVHGDPQGIGYVSYAFLNGVHGVAYNGVDCNLRNATSGTYGGTRRFFIVTQGAPVGGLKQFIKWSTHSRAALKIVKTEWVPLH